MGMPVTTKGQVTIPKAVRDQLGLAPGSRVEFASDEAGRVTIRKAGAAASHAPDRFDRALGTATAMQGMSTDEIMKLLRGEDD